MISNRPRFFNCLTRIFLILSLVLGGVYSAFAADELPSKTLAKIRKDGVIRIGVKTDVPPFNSINSSGEIVGLESDIAQKVAEKLDVKLLKVGITTENRFQKLEVGDVDMLIATIGDTPARRQIATGIEPGYSETSVSVLFRPEAPLLTKWADLRGKTLCALQGSYFNRPISERFLISLQTYKTVRDAHLALESGKCDGFLYTTAAIVADLKKPAFQGFKSPLEPALKTPWAIFVQRSEKNTELDHIVGDLIVEMHRSGYFLELNKKWDVDYSTAWLEKAKSFWAQKNNNQYLCKRIESGYWTPECREAALVNSEEVHGLQAIGLWVKEQTGLDLNFIYDPYSRGQYLQGLGYTMLLIFLSILLSIGLGIVSAIKHDHSSEFTKKVISFVMSYGRLNPPLLLMYLLYFGVGSWLLSSYGVQLPALLVAVLILGYYTSGLVMSALLESAELIRHTKSEFKINYHNILDTLDSSSWPIKQALINLTKQSMIASAIAIPELLSATNLVMAEKGNVFLLMTVLLIIFFFITGFWTDIVTWAETKFHNFRRVNHG